MTHHTPATTRNRQMAVWAVSDGGDAVPPVSDGEDAVPPARNRQMALWVACASVFALLAGLDRTSGQAARPKPDPTPAIARIAGIRVGVDTFKTLKARLGPGAAMNGCRGYVWTWRAAQCVVRATFSPTPEVPNAPVLDSETVRVVSLEYMPREGIGNPACPNVHGYVRQFGWLGAVIPGTTRAKLASAVRDLPRCEQHGDEMIWRATVPGAAELRWAAVVRLKDGKVASIRVATP